MLFPKPPVTRSPTPNFEHGRASHRVVGICFHIADGSRDSVVSWFANPASRVSAHFLICRDGSILQFVDEADTAWTQGILSQPTWPLLAQYRYPNQVLIGIEHEGTFEQPWTEPEYAADLALSLYLCSAYNIKPERPYLLGHSDLDTVSRAHCPGPNFPWERLAGDLQQLLRPDLTAWLPPVLLEARRVGISDGSRPMEPVTRAEALAMVMRAADDMLPAPAIVPMPPSDAPTWLRPLLQAALAYRITTGADLSGMARRVEVMAFAVRALIAAQLPSPEASATWWDLQIYPALAQGHGISDGTRPGEICTRGEAMAMALRLHQLVAS